MDKNEFLKEDIKIAFSLTSEERQKTIEEIIKKNKTILYVFEQSILPKSNFNYKAYVNSVLWFVSSANALLNEELTFIKINLHSLIMNDFEKREIKKIILENNRFLEDLRER